MINLRTAVQNPVVVATATKTSDKNVLKSESNTQKKTFKTNTGLKLGAGYATLASAIIFGLWGVSKLKNNKALSKFYASILSKNIPVNILCAIGCGFLVDRKINKKHAQLAADLRNQPVDELMKKDKNIQKTEKGNPYYKSKVGTKIGAALGLGVWILATAVNIIQNKKLPKNVNIFDLVDSLATPLIGGQLLGMATDYISNQYAEKHADKNSK